MFTKVIDAIKKEAAEKEARKVREAPYRFNVFELCGIHHQEMSHSRILASLLDPQGSHGLGPAFLVAFLRRSGVECPRDVSTVKADVEYFGDEAGRFDIYLHAEDDWHVIIENKIYAAEGESQLARYAEWLQSKKGYRCLLFLTLDGRMAETAEGASYRRVSYSQDVCGWLDECVQIAACVPFVRETLRQYRWFLAQISGATHSSEINSAESVFAEYSRVPGFLAKLRDVPEWHSRMVNRAALQIVMDFDRNVDSYGYGISEYSMRTEETYARFYVDPKGGGFARINFEFGAENLGQLLPGVYWWRKDQIRELAKVAALEVIGGRDGQYWIKKLRASDVDPVIRNWDEEFLSHYLTDDAFKSIVINRLKELFVALAEATRIFNDVALQQTREVSTAGQ